VIWLGAVKESSKPEIKELIPWDLKSINYHGLASHNPLARDVRDPGEMRRKREEEKVR
jgi:hypothetical protein